MAKRKQRKASRASVKLPAEAAAAAGKIQAATGWSANQAVGFLATAGVTALYAADAERAIAAMRSVLTAAVDAAEAERAAATLIGGATAKLRAARREMLTLAPRDGSPTRPPDGRKVSGPTRGTLAAEAAAAARYVNRPQPVGGPSHARGRGRKPRQMPAGGPGSSPGGPEASGGT